MSLPLNRTKKKKLKFVDLFSGAGGLSTGAIRAAERAGYEVEVTAVNHWIVATETFKKNHPYARVLCTGVDDVDPYKLYKPGELDGLFAAPECTEHSYAKGGRAVNDQRRVTAWCVVRWAEALLPPIIIVENVANFLKWGPIDSKGKPIKKRQGEIYRAWKQALISMGYKFEAKLMHCDRYGVPTTRRRLIVQCVRGNRRIIWPQETHAPLAELNRQTSRDGDMFLGLRPSVPARDIIDWSIKGRWLDEMPPKRQYGGLPLSPKTLRRIFAGFEKYGVKPFILPGQDGRKPHEQARTRSIDVPLDTVVADGHKTLVEPFVVPQNAGGNRARSIHEPVPTVAGRGVGSLVEPFVVEIDHTGGNGKCVRSLDEGMSTITSKARHCLVEPLVVTLRGTSERQLDRTAKPVSEPLGAVTAGGGHNALVEPFLVQCTHGDGGDPKAPARRVRSLNDPVPTVCGRGDLSLIEPHLLPQHGGAVMRPVSEPMPTVAVAGAIALVSPYIIKFYGNGGAASVDRPLDTVTGHDRFALLCPEVGMSDGTRRRVRFRFRMFQLHELQLAQGFPKEYVFTGTKSDAVKQVGNAVPPPLIDAIMSARLRDERRRS